MTLPQLRTHLIRHRPLQQAPEEPMAWASVALLIRPSPTGPELLFMERSTSPHDPWSGHMAFPGGRRDPEDGSLIVTAVRETLEEIGVDLNQDGEVIGHLGDLRAIGRGKRLPLLIRPHVFLLNSAPLVIPNHEVADTLWAPLSTVLDPANDRPYHPPGVAGPAGYPALPLGDKRVWGLTYEMLRSLRQALEGQPSAERRTT